MIREDGSVAEVVIKAPIAEMKLAATASGIDPPTDREVAEVAMNLAQEEYDGARRQEMAASQMCTVLVALATAVLDGHTITGGRRGVNGGEIILPRSLIDRVTGAKLGISETGDRDVKLRFRERAETPIQPEEMRL